MQYRTVLLNLFNFIEIRDTFNTLSLFTKFYTPAVSIYI